MILIKILKQQNINIEMLRNCTSQIDVRGIFKDNGPKLRKLANYLFLGEYFFQYILQPNISE